MGFAATFAAKTLPAKPLPLILQALKDLPHAAKQTVICDNG
jgi:hypothetical protein